VFGQPREAGGAGLQQRVDLTVLGLHRLQRCPPRLVPGSVDPGEQRPQGLVLAVVMVVQVLAKPSHRRSRARQVARSSTGVAGRWTVSRAYTSGSP